MARKPVTMASVDERVQEMEKSVEVMNLDLNASPTPVGRSLSEGKPRNSPTVTYVPVTYTTKSGEVVTTKKALQHAPSFILSETPDAPTLGVAILGYRRFGRKHLKDVFDNQACRVHFIVEFDSQLAAQAREDMKQMGVHGCEVIQDQSRVNAVCADSKVALVIVSCLILRKKEYVTAALKARKICLCDRPLAHNAQDVRELFELARQNNCVLLTNLPGRPGKAFSPVVMSLMSSASIIKLERLESPNSAGGDFANAPAIDVKSEQTEAMLVDVAMHDIGAINFCMCMRPVSVAAAVSPTSSGVVLVDCVYPNGAEVQVKGLVGQEEHDLQQFTLYGDRLSDMRRVDHMHVSDMRRQTSMSGDAAEVKGVRFNQVYHRAHRDALEQAYAFSTGNKEHGQRVRPYLMEQACLDNLRIATAAIKSLREGGKMVSLAYW
mmetsp:Transcript_58433/g.140858  ORF Transcript_58433/g.140858 Transcript_58433/m.140858 type:complete len:436 (-) Transcript_58433:161-1468(-)